MITAYHTKSNISADRAYDAITCQLCTITCSRSEFAAQLYRSIERWLNYIKFTYRSSYEVTNNDEYNAAGCLYMPTVFYTTNPVSCHAPLLLTVSRQPDMTLSCCRETARCFSLFRKAVAHTTNIIQYYILSLYCKLPVWLYSVILNDFK